MVFLLGVGDPQHGHHGAALVGGGVCRVTGEGV